MKRKVEMIRSTIPSPSPRSRFKGFRGVGSRARRQAYAEANNGYTNNWREDSNILILDERNKDMEER